MRNSRAIIFFVRDERHEAALKPLPAGYRRAGYGALNRHVAARLAPLLGEGIDLIVAGESEPVTPIGTGWIAQRGASFGDRITAAIEDTLNLGYDDVVVVGNDCPSILPADIRGAFKMLAGGAPIAAAPTRDGGAFLIALRGDRFKPLPFASLPWQTVHLFEALCSLPGTIPLPILRDDFDTWSLRRGVLALDALYGETATHLFHSIPPAPESPTWRVKARTRIHLPAPPAR